MTDSAATTDVDQPNEMQVADAAPAGPSAGSSAGQADAPVTGGPDDPAAGAAETPDPAGTPDQGERATAGDRAGSELHVREGDIAADYLERLLDLTDFDGDIDLDVENDRAIVAVLGGTELTPLIGPDGATLDALQALTRLAVHQRTGVRTRLMLDIGGYRAGRREELARLAKGAARSVLAEGRATELTPMNAFERKVVHDVISATDGVVSSSTGTDPSRRVVISPAA